MTTAQQTKFSKIYTADKFKVGDFVHLRTWTVPPEGKQTPVVMKKPMRIVETYVDHLGKTIFVCGGNRQFDAQSLIPSEWRPR